MTTLSTDKSRDFQQGELNDTPVIATDIIYEGAAVGDNGSGYARPLVAGDPFLGFAVCKADNNAGSAGDVYVRTKVKGRVKLNISGLAITDVGKPVYASDDDAFTLTASTNSCIGRVVGFASTGVGYVEFDATRAALGRITPLTDNSTGTASDTIASISDAATKNAIASIAAKLNSIIGNIK